MLLSTKGRYIWCEKGFDLEIGENITIYSEKFKPVLEKCGDTLKSAYLDLCKKYLKPDGKVPPEMFFTMPQYNTWMELGQNQTQDGVLNYAKDIIKNGMPVGILMIDDIWGDYYGNWEFSKNKFHDPKNMIDELHKMGFIVMLWTCPFISPDCKEFRELEKKGLLVKNKNGSVSLKKWWNGYSAVLDMSNPKAVDWYKNINDDLMKKYGVDGFKFDAGDAFFYDNDDVTYGNVDANTQSELWAKFGLNYEYNEYRACFKMACSPLIQRLADKCHSWDDNGISSLIPNEMTQSMLGYTFSCPDMIGGGEYENFQNHINNIDQEIFVRYSQCSALMPMMQFSTAPWRVLSKENFEYCKEMAWLHTKYGKYIYDLAKISAKTGEPIVSPMEYHFPNENLTTVKSQFMLGDKYLIAPVVCKNSYTKDILLPKGKWEDLEQNIINGGQKITVDAPINKLIIYKKV